MAKASNQMSWQTKAVMAEAETKKLRVNFEELAKAKWRAEDAARQIYERFNKNRDLLGRLIARLKISPEVIQEVQREQRAANQASVCAETDIQGEMRERSVREPPEQEG